VILFWYAKVPAFIFEPQENIGYVRVGLAHKDFEAQTATSEHRCIMGTHVTGEGRRWGIAWINCSQLPVIMYVHDGEIFRQGMTLFYRSNIPLLSMFGSGRSKILGRVGEDTSFWQSPVVRPRKYAIICSLVEYLSLEP
jgi:hypothetical protein